MLTHLLVSFLWIFLNILNLLNFLNFLNFFWIISIIFEAKIKDILHITRWEWYRVAVGGIFVYWYREVFVWEELFLGENIYRYWVLYPHLLVWWRYKVHRFVRYWKYWIIRYFLSPYLCVIFLLQSLMWQVLEQKFLWQRYWLLSWFLKLRTSLPTNLHIWRSDLLIHTMHTFPGR